jgi:hypothetical protein
MAQFQRVISLTSAPQVRISAECRKSLGSMGVVLRLGFEPTTFACTRCSRAGDVGSLSTSTPREPSIIRSFKPRFTLPTGFFGESVSGEEKRVNAIFVEWVRTFRFPQKILLESRRPPPVEAI